MEWKTIQTKPKAPEAENRAEKSRADTGELETNTETDFWSNFTVSVCTETELFNSNGREMPDRTSL